MFARSASKFYELLEKGVIVQNVLTLAVVGVSLYLFGTGQEVPSTLIQWSAFMLGLYGAAKVNSLTKKEPR